jgi:hypothetical protein
MCEMDVLFAARDEFTMEEGGACMRWVVLLSGALALASVALAQEADSGHNCVLQKLEHVQPENSARFKDTADILAAPQDYWEDVVERAKRFAESSQQPSNMVPVPELMSSVELYAG